MTQYMYLLNVFLFRFYVYECYLPWRPESPFLQQYKRFLFDPNTAVLWVALGELLFLSGPVATPTSKQYQGTKFLPPLTNTKTRETLSVFCLSGSY